MFLITKDNPKPRRICRECRAVHEEKDCPNAVDWAAVKRVSDAACAQMMAYQERILREERSLA